MLPGHPDEKIGKEISVSPSHRLSQNVQLITVNIWIYEEKLVKRRSLSTGTGMLRKLSSMILFPPDSRYLSILG